MHAESAFGGSVVLSLLTSTLSSSAMHPLQSHWDGGRGAYDFLHGRSGVGQGLATLLCNSASSCSNALSANWRTLVSRRFRFDLASPPFYSGGSYEDSLRQMAGPAAESVYGPLKE